MECPTFYPTLEEFKATSLEEYVQRHEGACQAAGVMKVVAPEGWRPRRADYEDIDLLLPR